MPRDYDDDDDRPRKRRRRDDEDEDDERPRTRRRPNRHDDDEDEQPRRKRKSQAQTRQVNVVGIIAMIVGIIALIIGVLPCVGTFGFIPGLIGVILGTIGLVIAKKSNGRQGGGMAIAGLSTGAVAIILSIVWFVVVGRVTKKLDDVADERNQIREREAEVIKNSAAPSLTAAALATAVDTNRAKAEADYKGRVVELTGTVYRLELDSPPTIQLDAVGDWVVNCNFPTSQTSELRRRLKIGTPVTIRGRVEQINQRGIVLKNCILVN